MKKKIIVFFLLLMGIMGIVSGKMKFYIQNIESEKRVEDKNFIVYKTKLENKAVKMNWLDNNGKALNSMKRFVEYTGKDKILFATNGGIYKENYTPEGLYIENYLLMSEINLKDGEGNFYVKPNGIFYIKNGKPYITDSEKFVYDKDIQYAVQSGPLLIENGKISTKFSPDSKSLKLRSGVGVTDDGELVFLMSSEKVNFYEFMEYALKKLNCKDFLFLDGTISKMYFKEDKRIPEQNYPFVTIISIEEKK